MASAVTATTGTPRVEDAVPQPAQRLCAVDPGQLEVDEHQVGRLLPGHVQAFLARRRLEHVVPGVLEARRAPA